MQVAKKLLFIFFTFLQLTQIHYKTCPIAALSLLVKLKLRENNTTKLFNQKNKIIFVTLKTKINNLVLMYILN